MKKSGSCNQIVSETKQGKTKKSLKETSTYKLLFRDLNIHVENGCLQITGQLNREFFRDNSESIKEFIKPEDKSKFTKLKSNEQLNKQKNNKISKNETNEQDIQNEVLQEHKKEKAQIHKKELHLIFQIDNEELINQIAQVISAQKQNSVSSQNKENEHFINIKQKLANPLEQVEQQSPSQIESMNQNKQEQSNIEQDFIIQTQLKGFNIASETSQNIPNQNTNNRNSAKKNSEKEQEAVQSNQKSEKETQQEFETFEQLNLNNVKNYKMNHQLQGIKRGIRYQFLIILFQMLKKLRKNNPFKVMIECAEFGNLDDFVIIAKNSKGNLQTKAYQIKYFIKEQIKIEDFINKNNGAKANQSKKNSKMHIGKLFLGFLNLEKKFTEIAIKKIVIKLIIYTNTSLNDSLKQIVSEDGKFKSEFINSQLQPQANNEKYLIKN